MAQHKVKQGKTQLKVSHPGLKTAKGVKKFNKKAAARKRG